MIQDVLDPHKVEGQLIGLTLISAILAAKLNDLMATTDPGFLIRLKNELHNAAAQVVSPHDHAGVVRSEITAKIDELFSMVHDTRTAR